MTAQAPTAPQTREPEAPPQRSAKPFRWGRFLRQLILFALACFFLMPVYALLVTALKDPAHVDVVKMWNLPDTFSLESFRTVIPQLLPGLRNSLTVSILASTISSLLGAANGFVLAKWRFPGADLAFPIILFGMFIPYQAIIIPMFKLLSDVPVIHQRALGDTLFGLILVHIIYGLPITTLIFRSYFAGLPDELIEAAEVDGAGMLRTFFYIALPIAPPAFAVAMIWQFTSSWNDFLFGLILTDTEHWPVTVALNNIAGGQTVPFNQAMASAFLASIPTLLVYALLGRFFMRGLMAGALKS
ncbi:MAG: carbohydrate ABC transporter permease [Hamadaea sp.]|uniref:carbohydrate ABC transporter permease n=1 Tax=Hamadaea sp. TaxID=2024425 RepID=UPI00179FF4DF|nr:carbohydrate ABC transporter permease [Hamadaea sp.]NUR72110.1 carbohydrate ABC transporter permease [Hamadaea sp.]NUT22943.1 carbohydrate ABC transporter permease [Hamadaea sp.]